MKYIYQNSQTCHTEINYGTMLIKNHFNIVYMFIPSYKRITL